MNNTQQQQPLKTNDSIDSNDSSMNISKVDTNMNTVDVDKFWIEDPTILLKEDKIKEVWISKNMTRNEKLNAITRLVIILTLLGYFFTRSLNILVSGIATLVVIVVLYYSTKKKDVVEGLCSGSNIVNEFYNSAAAREHYTYPTIKNPTMNVLLPEILDNPKRNQAAPPTNQVIANEINTMAKEMTLQNLTSTQTTKSTENERIALDKKLYSDLGDNFEFEQGMRQFYTTPNTTIPNNQKDFAEFCYSDIINSKSKKED